MRKTFKVAIFAFMTLSLFSGAILAKQNINNTERIILQDEGNLPYDQWYGPDDTIDTEERDIPDSVVIPEAPDDDVREAPEEDPRPQVR